MDKTLLTIVIVGIGAIIQGIVALLAAKWRGRVSRALFLPASVLIWLVVAAHVVGIWVVEPGLSEWLVKVRLLAVVALSAWALIRLQSELNGEGTAHWWGRMVIVAVVIAAFLVVLQVLGINISGILAFGGFGAVAVGIAGRELFANLFGGRMLFVTQAFREGEQINAPKAGVQGVVERIGWYQTTLLTHSKAPMTVPNAFFMSEVVVNESRSKFRERKVALDVQADRLAEVVEKLQPMVTSIELVAIRGEVAHLRAILQTPLAKEEPTPLKLGEQLRASLGKDCLGLTFER